MIRINNQEEDSLSCLSVFFGVNNYLDEMIDNIESIVSPEDDNECFQAFNEALMSIFSSAVDFASPVNLSRISVETLRELYASEYIMELVDNKDKASHSHTVQVPVFGVACDMVENKIVTITPPSPIIPVRKYSAVNIDSKITYGRPDIIISENGLYDVVKKIKKGMFVMYIRIENYTTSEYSSPELRSMVKQKSFGLFSKKETIINNSKNYGLLSYNAWDITGPKKYISLTDNRLNTKKEDNFKLNKDWEYIQKEWNKICTTGKGELDFKVEGVKKGS